ncbi:hypothetical protein [Gordonia araii]|uniref:hypothetical protein n=1 Tax=Gordonia araii TaxID=263909 RepID=UPI0003002FB3|nr:hypothetical protein [Gordonia araii]NNG98814.1 hypothetical protein [Gordonia araii NBRC 100433]
MNNANVALPLLLIAVTVAVLAFVAYRRRESKALLRDAALARDLREAAGADAVRLAAVDEFETTIYQRLFYASVVGPKVRSAAFSLLGLLLSLGLAVLLAPSDGLTATTAKTVAAVLVVVFGIATVVFAGWAVYHLVSTPRVSFVESYDDDEDE